MKLGGCFLVFSEASHTHDQRYMLQFCYIERKKNTPRHTSDQPPVLAQAPVNTQNCSSLPQTQHSHDYFCSTD